MAWLQIDLHSRALHRQVPVNVLLPIDPREPGPLPQGPFPTLYLLHGVTDDHTSWLLNTRIAELSARHGVCVVLPAGENSFYLDQADRFALWDTYVGRELVELTRACLPLSRRREDTWIGGFSMGGCGALRNGLKYHATFGAVVALSAALELAYTLESTYDEPNFLFNRGFVEGHYGDLEAALHSDRNPLWLIEHLDREDFPRLFLASGEQDMLSQVQGGVVSALEARGVPVNHCVVPGAHDWDFVNRVLPDALAWLSARQG